MKLTWEELEILLWKQNRDRNCRSPIMCHKGTATEEPGEPPFCKHSLFTEGFLAEVRFKAVEGNSCWTDSVSDLIEGRNRIRIYKRSEREKINLPLRKEGKGRIFQSDMSCLAKPPSFPLPLCLFTFVWYLFPPTEEHCHCGSGAKGKSVSNVLYVPSASLLSSSISV